jgi:predicted ATPase/DNA-binding SARP family transcriptional activator/Flp pilus assembly protein TadD
MARLSLSLLGPLHVTLDGMPASGFGYNKVRALLAHLAVEADRAHHRDALVGLLWPDLPDKAARTNLRQALTTLREALGDATAATPFLLVTRETVQFNPQSSYDLDVLVLETCLAECRSHSHRGPDRCRPCAARMKEAVAHYRGDFLAQFSLPDSTQFEEWTLLKRERLRHGMLEMLAHLAAYHERRGEFEEAQRHVRRQLELDPWREEAHRQLMRLLAVSGQRSAALTQYESCRRALADGLGVGPERETIELYEHIRDGELSVDDDIKVHQRGLPVPPTALVGRERELTRLSELSSDPGCRLITITGPGGIGKTRLAIETARAEYPGFTDGAVVINLAPLGESAQIAPSILSGLGVPLEGQNDPERQLIDLLQNKELLLILDNFDHLLTGVSLIQTIMERAPSVTVLVTSRERLALQAEWLVELTGLECPDVEVNPHLDDFSAAQLFLQRARQVQNQFTPGEQEARAVARICRQVEGMPLAIELAAASVRHRSCVQLAEDLERDLHVLAATARDVPERHQSMRAAFEQSWRLLPDDERRVFTQLAVFRGGFDDEAAMQVAAASLPLLTALRDKSLLNRNPGGRYEMHELIRQYAGEKLFEAGGAEGAYARHLAYFVNLAEAAEPELIGEEQQRWLDRLQVEHNNLISAMTWAHKQDDVESIARLAGSLHAYWVIHSHFRLGRRWLESTLVQKDRLTTAIRARALHAVARLTKSQQEYEKSRDWNEECLALYRVLGDTQGLAEVLKNLGHLQFEHESYAEAKSCFEEALPIFRTLNEPRGISSVLIGLGLVAMYQGDYPEARRHFEESLALARAANRMYNIACSLGNLGMTSLYEGDDGKAQQWFRESLTLSSKLGAREDIAGCLEGMAALFSRQKQPANAAKLYGAAEKLRDQIGAPIPASDQTYYERMKTEVRAQLGESAFNIAWARGQAMTLKQVIAEALGEDAAPEELGEDKSV